MNKSIDERINKLPKWASDHIEQCHRKINHLEDKITKILGERGTSDVNAIIDYNFPNDETFPIPTEWTISYRLEERERRDGTFGTLEVRLEDDHLRISSMRGIIAKPVGSNVFHIYYDDLY